MAAASGQSAVVQTLLLARADVEATDNDGVGILPLAWRSGKKSLYWWLYYDGWQFTKNGKRIRWMDKPQASSHENVDVNRTEGVWGASSTFGKDKSVNFSKQVRHGGRGRFARFTDIQASSQVLIIRF